MLFCKPRAILQAQATYGKRRLETGTELANIGRVGFLLFLFSGDGEYSPKWEARVGTYSMLHKSRCRQHWMTIWNRSEGPEPDGWHKIGFSGGNVCHWGRHLPKGVFKDKEVDKNQRQWRTRNEMEGNSSYDRNWKKSNYKSMKAVDINIFVSSENNTEWERQPSILMVCCAAV